MNVFYACGITTEVTSAFFAPIHLAFDNPLIQLRFNPIYYRNAEVIEW